MKRHMTAARLIAAGLLAILAGSMAGCELVQPSALWVEQNESFLTNVVEAELMPRYETHPDVSDADLANVQAAIDQHREFLDDLESEGTQSP